MIEYRERSGAPKQTAPVTSSSKGLFAGYENLTKQYGLPDMEIVDPMDQEEQTVEQEYQAYITSPVAPTGTCSIKFWQVSSTASIFL